MIIEISVVPKSGKFRIEKRENRIKVYLRSPPEGNKANLELVRELERIFGRPVAILSGSKSKKKKIELPITKEGWDSFISKI